MALALEYPNSGTPYRARRGRLEIRSMLLRSFPVQVFYVVYAETVVVIDVAHTSRRPGYWRKRLKDVE